MNFVFVYQQMYVKYISVRYIHFLYLVRLNLKCNTIVFMVITSLDPLYIFFCILYCVFYFSWFNISHLAKMVYYPVQERLTSCTDKD